MMPSFRHVAGRFLAAPTGAASCLELRSDSPRHLGAM